MNLFKLKSNVTKTGKRVGRGNGSGCGTYSGRGMKGQNSRTGGKRRPGFEGGQTPLIRKMPKIKGFRSPNQVNFQVVNVGKLETSFEEGAIVDVAALYKRNLISKKDNPVKVLGEGELKKKLDVSVDKISKSAKEKIEKAKGKATETISPKVKAAPKKAKVEKKPEKEENSKNNE